MTSTTRPAYAIVPGQEVSLLVYLIPQLGLEHVSEEVDVNLSVEREKSRAETRRTESLRS